MLNVASQASQAAVDAYLQLSVHYEMVVRLLVSRIFIDTQAIIAINMKMQCIIIMHYITN